MGSRRVCLLLGLVIPCAACAAEIIEGVSGLDTGDTGSGTAATSVLDDPSTATTATEGDTTSAETSGTSELCDQVCVKVSDECDFTVSCETVKSYCDDCTGQCVLDATCEQIATLFTSDRDPQLVACIDACPSD